jgi:hypothetical protein
VSWISARLKERQFRHDRQRIISDGAEEVFKRLWVEIKKWVDEAKHSGEKVDTNGSPHERVVTMRSDSFTGMSISPDVYSATPASKKLSVKFLPEKPSIVANAAGIDVQFDIDLDEDNVACLKHNGKTVEYLDAAITILDPFIFPDLQSRNSESQIPDEALSMDEQAAMRRMRHNEDNK